MGKAGKVSKRKDKSSELDKAGKKKGLKKKSGKGEKDAAMGGAHDKKGTKAKRPTAKSMAARRYYEQVKVDGEVFNRGDCAYVIGDKTRDLDDDELEPCGACGECGDEDDVMLECDACLRGWHMRCLHPPLEEVPEGEWYCPKCLSSATGVAAPAENGRRMAHTEFLAGNLHLCRIECIWQEANGKFMFVGRWFATPEETHTGRQAHHSRREVFLTNNTDENCVDSLLRKAAVLLPQQYRDATRLANEAAATARRKAREAKAARDRGEEPSTGSSSPMTRSRTKTRHLSRRRLRGMTCFCASTRTISTSTGSSEGPSGTTTIYPTTTCRGRNFFHGGLTLVDEDDEDEDLDGEDSDADIDDWGGSKGSKKPSSKKGARGKGKGAQPSAYPSGAGLEEESSAGTSPRRAGRQPRRRVNTAASWVSEPSQCRESTNRSRPQRWAARGRHCRWRTPPALFRAATSNARKLLTLWSSPSTLVRSVWAGVCTSRVFQARARRRRCAK